MAVASTQDMVLVGWFALIHTVPFFANIPWHKASCVAVMACKGATRISASISMGAVQYITVEEDDIAWIRRAGHFWVLTGDGRELVYGSILVRRGVVVKNALQHS
jgi:hypothetical protein